MPPDEIAFAFPDWKDWNRLGSLTTSADMSPRDRWLVETVPFLSQARLSQRPPLGDWRTWLVLGGRGSGKTRAGAEWVDFAVRFGGAQRVALVGQTRGDVREVMVEGPSGLLSLHRPEGEDRPRYEASRYRLVYPCGAQAFAFSAFDPDGLRGPQFDAAWCDELAAWPKGGRAWDMLQLALRLGDSPRAVVTTTPRPIPLIKRLVSDPQVALTRMRTDENAANLAPGFVAEMERMYGQSALARQELNGEIVETIEGALWSRGQLAGLRIAERPAAFADLVVAVDPPAGQGPGADGCGIIAAGLTVDLVAGPRCYILADASCQGLKPIDWAGEVDAVARRFGAARIVAEANQGGEMVRHTLESAGCNVPISLVHARLGKEARALPVSACYDRNEVLHAPGLETLEEEMCVFGTEAQSGSPDRVDALVWAVWTLLVDRSLAPRLREL